MYDGAGGVMRSDSLVPRNHLAGLGGDETCDQELRTNDGEAHSYSLGGSP